MSYHQHQQRAEDALVCLQRAGPDFGQFGRRVALLANHFELHFNGTSACQRWLAWEVDVLWDAANKGSKGGKGGEGGMGGKGGKAASDDATREPGKKIRTMALQLFLEAWPEDSWLYDGNHRLYTSLAFARPLQRNGALQLPGVPSPVRVRVQEATDQGAVGQQVVDLGRIRLGSGSDPASEELRFLHVALRRHAVEAQGLITRGRKIICPELSLGCHQEQAFLRGREVWMGYVAQSQCVEGLHGTKFTMNLNLVGSVGLREMPAIKLLAHFLHFLVDHRWNAQEWREYLESGGGAHKVGKILHVLNSAMGMRKVRVRYGWQYLKDCHGRPYEKHADIKGLTERSAREQYFYHEQYGQISVEMYFDKRYSYRLRYPHLPLLQLQTLRNCVPIELVTILGREHNIMSGKLRSEYQAAVGKVTTMIPQSRQREILSLMSGANKGCGPCDALQRMGLHVSTDMLEVPGRVLDMPGLSVKANGYANQFQAIAPPKYAVRWGIWCYAKGGEWNELDNLVSEWVRKGKEHNITFDWTPCPKVWKRGLEGGDELWSELANLHQTPEHQRLHLLVVLLPTNKDECKVFYGQLKTWTEIYLRSFATQCINCSGKRGQSELEGAKQKFNNVLLKVTAKLAREKDGSGAAHSIELLQPHWLLNRQAGTMLLGADVTHDCGGISIAGVVASSDGTFSAYFSSIRAQCPFMLGEEKQRRRQSEERIIGFAGMAKDLLLQWRKANGRLPQNIVLYRDGVSYGQFTPVLTYEFRQLHEAFADFGSDYQPKVVIIVGQKRHHTRFFCGGKASGKGHGSGKGFEGKGFEQPAHLEPGTVAGEGIAAPGHLNFFLVSHQGLKGTSVPCHYHVLHKDTRLGIKVDDIERMTHEICHMYSRADKTVSYASPAYMADHLCERGKLYMETIYGPLDDSAWSTPPGSSDGDAERRFREKVQERVNDFNSRYAWKLLDERQTQQGRNYFC